MITEIALTIFLSCPLPTIKNYTDSDWNFRDKLTFDQVTDKCEGRGKCISLFEKARDNGDGSYHYNVLCRMKRWQENEKGFYPSPLQMLMFLEP